MPDSVVFGERCDIIDCALRLLPLSQLIGVVVYPLPHSCSPPQVGYLAFFAAMHAVALVGGPLTFSWDCLQLCLAG